MKEFCKQIAAVIPKILTKREQRWLDTFHEVKAIGLEAAMKDNRLRRWLHRQRTLYQEALAMDELEKALEQYEAAAEKRKQAGSRQSNS